MKIKDYVDELEDKRNILTVLKAIVDVDLPNCHDAFLFNIRVRGIALPESGREELLRQIDEVTSMFTKSIDNITVTIKSEIACLTDEIEQIRETIV